MLGKQFWISEKNLNRLFWLYRKRYKTVVTEDKDDGARFFIEFPEGGAIELYILDTFSVDD